MESAEAFEYWTEHPRKEHADFCKAYAKWRRIHHHYHYLACLFSIQKI